MSGRRWMASAVLALPLAAAPALGLPQPVHEPRDAQQREATVGTATMTADKTLVLRLRSQDGTGAIVEGLFSYAPGDPDYLVVLRHVGPLAPGETVPVRPFADEKGATRAPRR